MKRDISLVETTTTGWGGGGGDDQQQSKRHKDNICLNDDQNDMLVIANDSQNNIESMKHSTTSNEFTIKETCQECHNTPKCVDTSGVDSIQSTIVKQVSIPTSPIFRDTADRNKCDKSSVFRDHDSSTTESMTIVNRKEQQTSQLPWNVIDNDMVSSSSDSDISSSSSKNAEHEEAVCESKVKHYLYNQDKE